MFQEVKDTLPISGDDYDAQIIREIKACALDLTTSAEITLPGTIAITRKTPANTPSFIRPMKKSILDGKLARVENSLIASVPLYPANMWAAAEG